ncbi:MOSC domain-containing protein [bacterium]|nr:MAG: MOSC domain-containing protein [bacterium]
MPRLLSLNVGLPRDVAWRGRTVHTAVWKSSVRGKRMARRLNIDGDGQGDLAGHGGEQRAVFVYQIEAYRYWERELARSDFTLGQFGENFTIAGMPDDEVCIGDRYGIGGALFEVTQPRVTCYRVGIRLAEPRMPALLYEHHRPGFYFRVLEEGEIESGDEIVKVADGPEHMTVAQASALLYLPGHPVRELERALRIPAFSPGWQGSFRALLEQERSGTAAGNRGLAPDVGPPPAWPGFRALVVRRSVRESNSVVSLYLAPPDGGPLAAGLPGQFVTLRLQPQPQAPPVVRSFSLSGAPESDDYRISVKREPGGVASTYLCDRVRGGDTLQVSAPRGAFTLQAQAGPIVLLGAGVGATPLLAMLHALAATGDSRPVWWLYGARSGAEHPFAAESRAALQSLPHGRAFIAYSKPTAVDRLGIDYDVSGHLSIAVLEQLDVPREADFYLCGPAEFMGNFSTGFAAWGVAANRIHTEIFGPGPSLTPGIAGVARVPVHAPSRSAGTGPRVSFARSGLAVRWDSAFNSLLELAEACDVPVRWSCRTGVCHTCECGMFSGTVKYQPQPLDAPAAGDVLICCSQPMDDVVLDL